MSEARGSIRFLHTSDWQLGMTRHFLSEEAGHRFSQDRIDAIRQLGALALAHDAAFIVVAGDIFESNQLSQQTVLRTVDALKQLPVPIFLLPGNHDPLDVSSIFSTPQFTELRSDVFVIRDQQPIAVPGLSGVEVVGAPWRTKHPNSDLCADMLAGLSPAEGVVRIAVCHGQPDTLSPDKSRPEVINLANVEAALDKGLIHYLALGDRHSATNVSPKTGRVWFSGAPVATDFTETNPNQALLVEVDQERCDVTELAVGAWQFVTGQFDLNNSSDLDQFSTWLDALTSKERSVVKVGFTGAINLATAAEKDELLERQAEVFAGLWQRERTTELSIVPDQLDQDSVSLAGYAKDAWDDLLESAGNDTQAQDALRLFYRLSQRGAQE